ncbi:MAG TPA: hypothetical protein VGN57_08425 [Pirellulaceae bacterium]|jgi:hypothetical protein|nr:hypothetical protein [Pirellulaceae bacterium]
MRVNEANARPSRRQFVVGSLAAVSTATLSAATGCGTLMHPERVGQTRRGNVDWTVVGLDAIGLCFFFIPGIIAFAVDFGNGAMFFPAEPDAPATATATVPTPQVQPANATQASTVTPELRSVPLPPGKLTLDDLARIASRETGRRIELEQGTYETEPMDSLDDFWTLERRLAEQNEAAS